MSESNDEEVFLTPPELTDTVTNAQMSFLLQQSREKYLKQYDIFNTWRQAKGAKSFSENVLLAYFIELSKTKKSSTLWSTYSMLKATLNISGSCGGFSYPQPLKLEIHGHSTNPDEQDTAIDADFTFSTVSNEVVIETDPLEDFQLTLNQILFGDNLDVDIKSTAKPDMDVDMLAHYPNGNTMRAEVFQNKNGVHLPMAEWLHRGHCYLNTSVKDFMQTAVNAFSILLVGSIDDVLRMPSMYVLRSARTISMMRIAREKLVATWTVVKGDQTPDQITYETLEYYRPLFKYINGREMSRLNLDDERILSYIGTHADLDRHQVGVIASRYIERNKNWRDAKYLNLMNNLLCGVPMKFMRRIPENIYLQLSHQLFYNIKACDPLQRRFYLAMMTRTQVLGKSNSWSARDVARLGLLLTEVDGPELSAINPEAMVGISSQVMMEMSAYNLKQITKMQLRYINQKPLNILIKKVNMYQEEQQILNASAKANMMSFICIPSFASVIVKYSRYIV